jgi:hypothetical protein
VSGLVPRLLLALFATFAPTHAAPGDRVTVRLAGGPPAAGSEAIRVFLVPNAVASSVRSPTDARLRFLGAFAGGKSRIDFTVPRDVAADTYTLAYDCPSCARYSFGRTFFSETVTARNTAASFRPRVTLVVGRPARHRLVPIVVTAALGGVAIFAVSRRLRR